MKRSLILALVLSVCTGAALFADDAMKKDSASAMKPAKAMTAKGTVMKVDSAGKMMTMKNAKGKEMTMYWDDSTKVTGEMKEGSMATVHYMMHDGKMMATSVSMKAEGMKKDEMKK